MEDKVTLAVIEPAKYDIQLREFEGGLVNFLNYQNLPSEGIFVGIPERINVFKNLEGVITQIDPKVKNQSLYLSKFIAGVASGLFDAALNYLWDETILQIRKRIVQYDLEYFYDNAVSGDKRKRVKDESDLVKIDDYELIKGAKEIGLISEVGFKHLEYINYMRNWVSAAHPNQNDITGLQLISWLETCVKEVISLPISNISIQIKQLLSKIKTNSISNSEAHEIAVFFTNITQEQVSNLVSGFFGIYTKTDTDSQVLQNINRLLPLIWERVDEDTRNSFGLKYGNFVANGYKDEKKLAREFLQLVDGESYIPDDLRIIEIETAIDNLASAHRGFNNFYNEPSFARQLQRIIGTPPKVPKPLDKKYTLTLVDVFLTNGNGVAHIADDIYVSLLSSLSSYQANVAALSFTNMQISSKLQFNICQRKFREMLSIIEPIITSPPIKDMIKDINAYNGRLDGLKNDKKIHRHIESLRVLLK